MAIDVNALKPCPFCGGKAKVYDDVDWSYGTEGRQYIACEKMCCRTMSYLADEGFSAVEQWNKRYEDPAIHSEVEKLEELKDSIIGYVEEIRGELEDAERDFSYVGDYLDDIESSLTDSSSRMEDVSCSMGNIRVRVDDLEDLVRRELNTEIGVE